MLRVSNKTPPWTEVVGMVEFVSNNEITLVCRRKYHVKLSDAELARHGHLLQPGKCVVLLILDDGTVRVRRLDSEGR